MEHKFSHIDDKGNPKMVDVSDKNISVRTATARCVVELGVEIMADLKRNDFNSKKGSIIQTAIVAGVMGVKKTSELIPMCHPLAISGCNIDIQANSDSSLEVICYVKISGKTGVEMEALTGASTAALTVYDMCKSYSKAIQIVSLELIEKTGGKSDYKRT